MITFRCDDGEVVEILGTRLNHCEEGETIDFVDDDGIPRRGTRMIIVPRRPRTKGVAGFTRQCRKWDPDFKKHTPDGNGAWDTSREREDVIARKRDKGENWSIG